MSRPSISPGRGARVVADTEKRIVGSQSRSRAAKVDLPAPEGEDRMMRSPRRAVMAYSTF